MEKLKNLMEKIMKKNIWRKAASLLLCLCMASQVLCDFTPDSTKAKELESRKGATLGVTREADPNTMDTYRDMLDIHRSTRYAGRLWTDKSVFAYGQDVSADVDSGISRNFVENKLELSEGLDGVSGDISLDSDFLEVYSALGSSLARNEYPQIPVDLVIALDMSGSMAQSTKYPVGAKNSDYNNGQGETMEERIENSRIKKTLDAVNTTIDMLMEQNPNNRVSVVAYGAGAAVLLPLDHYERNGGDAYLTIGGMETLFNRADLKSEKLQDGEYVWKWTQNRDACFTIVVNAKGDSEPMPIRETVSNNVDNDRVKAYPGYEEQSGKSGQDIDTTSSKKLSADEYIGYFTNTQGGIYLAYSQLAKNNETTYTGQLTGGESTTVARVPAAIIMTDGGANFAFNEMTDWKTNYGLEKDKIPEPSPYPYNEKDFDGKGFLYDSNPSVDAEDNKHRLHTKGSNATGNKGDEWYNVFLPGIGKGTDCVISSLYNMGIDDGALRSQPSWYHAGILYNTDSEPLGAAGTILEVLMTASYMKSVVKKHYESGWEEKGALADSRIPLKTFTLSVDSDHVPQWGKMRIYPTLDPEDYFLDSSHWNDEALFGQQSLNESTTVTDVLTSAKENWDSWTRGNDLTKDTGAVVNSSEVKINIGRLPEDGYSDENFGGISVTNQDVEDNIVYNDGFYDVSSGNLDAIFDQLLSLITRPLFNPISGMNDLNVSDSITFMDPIGEYMEVKDVKGMTLFGKQYDIKKTAVYSYKFNEAYIKAHADEAEGGYLKEGWYKGKNGKDAIYGGAGDKPDNGNAWEDGWVYRLNAKTASTYVPSLSEIKGGEDADEIVSKMRRTEYAFYIVDGELSEINKLRMNPAYGNADWEQLKEGMAGAYRLSDLRIWTEDTKGNIDDTVEQGGLQSDATYDQALWINIPQYMLPLRTVTVTQNIDNTWNYESNIPEGTADVSEGSANSASFPLRVFYTVGIEDSLLSADGTINAAGGISAEYIENNRVVSDAAQKARGLEKDDLEFFSNWYNPENRYGDYATSNMEYSYGDPATSFSPNGENSYYIFQNALPLYAAAYRYDGGSWEKVKIGEDGGSGISPDMFGGDIIAADLECEPGNISGSLGETAPKEGDIVLLKRDRLEDVNAENGSDPFPSDGYYFLPISYFRLDGSNKSASMVRYCITRKGSEFGSAYQASGISNGDMLCWYDASGKNKTIYPYLSYSETGDASRGKDFIGTELDPDTGYYMGCDKSNPEDLPDGKGQIQEGEEWIVAARPGGLCVGDLAQAVGEKTKKHRVGGQEKGGSKYTEYHEYKDERFPDKPENFMVGYYEGNVTRTANNYYLPTISVNSEAEDAKVIVNTYLGNNGRLVVSDTSLFMAKRVVPPLEGMSVDKSKEFSFQVYIKGRTGDYDAVVVKYDEGTGIWQRQFSYIDLQLDSKKFLLGTDGGKTMTDEQGRRVVQTGTDEDNGPVYAYADELSEPYSGKIYYVYIGTNADSGSNNDSGNFARLYDSESDVKNGIGTTAGKDGIQTFTADSVWLFTKEEYENFSVSETGGSAVGVEINDFELMKLIPATGTASGESSTDVLISSHYGTKSEYLTKTVSFNNENIAEVTMKHGRGLLFTGIPKGTEYRISEQAADGGYRMDRAFHRVGPDQTDEYVEKDFESGDFSINGDTGAYEEAAYFINTYDLDALEIAKSLESEDGSPLSEKDKDTPFSYTANFTLPESNPVSGTLGNLPYWKGKTEDVNLAPRPDETEKIEALADAHEKAGEVRLLQCLLGSEYSYEFELKADETIVVYGLPIGTTYEVTETKSEEYPAKGDKYGISGEIIKSGESDNLVANMASFTNVRPKQGSITIEKRIENDNPDVDAEFDFSVTLTAPSGSKLYPETFVIKGEPDWDGDCRPVLDTTDPADVCTITFKLRHGQKAVISNIPYGTTYAVKEEKHAGYNLQRVEDGTEGGDIIRQEEDGSITGTILDDGTADGIYMVFFNGRAPLLPMTGGPGRTGLCLGTGIIATSAAIAYFAFRRRKRKLKA